MKMDCSASVSTAAAQPPTLRSLAVKWLWLEQPRSNASRLYAIPGESTDGLIVAPHALIFVSAGAARSKEILDQSRGLLAELCAYRTLLCVTKRPAS
jgi:hypothetical protein